MRPRSTVVTSDNGGARSVGSDLELSQLKGGQPRQRVADHLSRYLDSVAAIGAIDAASRPTRDLPVPLGQARTGGLRGEDVDDGVTLCISWWVKWSLPPRPAVLVGFAPRCVFHRWSGSGWHFYDCAGPGSARILCGDGPRASRAAVRNTCCPDTFELRGPSLSPMGSAASRQQWLAGTG
jgi:hypothetical protein